MDKLDQGSGVGIDQVKSCWLILQHIEDLCRVFASKGWTAGKHRVHNTTDCVQIRPDRDGTAIHLLRSHVIESTKHGANDGLLPIAEDFGTEVNELDVWIRVDEQVCRFQSRWITPHHGVLRAVQISIAVSMHCRQAIFFLDPACSDSPSTSSMVRTIARSSSPNPISLTIRMLQTHQGLDLRRTACEILARQRPVRR